MSSGNVNALTMAEWNQIVGITTDAPSGDWKDIMPSATEMHDKVKAMFNEKIDALDVDDEHYARDLADLTSARDFWDGKDFSGGVAVSVEELEKGQVRAANGQVDEFMFIRGAYSERAALAASTQHFQDFRADILKKIEDGDFVSEDFANHFNDSSIQNSLGSITFADGTKVNAEISGGIVTLTAENKDGDPVDLGAYFNEGSVNGFGFTENITTANTISTSTRLSELKGVTADANGNFNMEINGAKFSFAGTTTISQMMTLVNSNAAAGVNLTFSTLTNTFELKTKEFGTGADIKLGDTAQGTLLNALGFDGVDLVAGENMRLQINGPSGQTVETASNSYDLNGTIITVGDNVVEGTTFDIIVEKDSSQLMNLIKDFVKDYNELIDFVFGFVNEKPDSAYYFLTDADRDELNLTEIQDKRREDKAKQGLLYNDRTLINLMSSMRTALYSGVSRGDGTMFGLFSMGITTSSNWRQNGKLVIDEKKLEDAITNNVEMVTELFTQAEKGLMPQIDRILQSALNTTGARHDKGLLIQRAGLANTSSDRDNSIFDQIKRLNDIIGNLELRYQKQQDRYWKIFSALEKQMGTLNGQSDYIGQMLGSFGANNR
jgi:flagellar hook-associated protein 2